MFAETVSIREFARRMSVSDMLIRRAISEGKIDATKKGRVVSIDFEKAKQQFYDCGIGLRKGIENDNDHETKSLSDLTADTATYQESKRREAFFKSELARLEMEEKSGKLVDRKQVESELFEAGTLIKERLLSIPDRIIDELLSSGRNQAHSLLRRSIVDVLTELSNMGNETGDIPPN